MLKSVVGISVLALSSLVVACAAAPGEEDGRASDAMKQTHPGLEQPVLIDGDVNVVRAPSGTVTNDGPPVVKLPANTLGSGGAASFPPPETASTGTSSWPTDATTGAGGGSDAGAGGGGGQPCDGTSADAGAGGESTR